MSILDLGTGPSRPSVGKKSTRIFLGFGLLVAVIGIGSTFASTISINANQDIEFGQGVERTVFCGGQKSITVTPISSFANSSDLGTFGLTGITVSDIPKECSDRNFIIKVYDNENATPLILSRNGDGNDSRMNLANVWWASGCPDDENENESACRLANYDTEDGVALLSKSTETFVSPGELAEIDNTNNAFTVIFKRNPLSTNDVKKVVIETQNDSFGFREYAGIENDDDEDA
jgi:hypothetical protein